METLYTKKNAKIATCSLNQWALDFEGNKNRIIESIKVAKAQGCTYRVGPELEICGYSCEDHFLELDTVDHSWEVLAEILKTDLTKDIIVDIGMPLIHKGALYNCRLVLLDQKVHYIRPKSILANDGNYRETRYFTAWKKKELEEFLLPEIIRQATGQFKVPIGIGIIRFNDTETSHEICEELWQPGSPHIAMGLDGAEIIFNSSGSHFSLGRINIRIALVKEATSKGGGAYVYSNQLGCDGTRLYFDGCSMVCVNGEFVAMGNQFTLQEVEVVIAVIDLDAIRVKKVMIQPRYEDGVATKSYSYPRIAIDFDLCKSIERPSKEFDEQKRILTKDAEIGYGPAVYLWDYMRKSKAVGYLLPLSGGADSAATALIIHHMCVMVYETISQKKDGHERVLETLRAILKSKDFYPKSANELTGKFLYTCYMRSKHSSDETSNRAASLASEIGATHMEVSIDDICKGYDESIKKVITRQPKFVKEGGDMLEDLALQNLQARSRMVLSYYMAQLIPVQYKLPGYLLVLGSANLDESLRGYMTKYDCSSADINPIGGFSKVDLRSFLYWSFRSKGIKSAAEIVEAIPSAELRPQEKGAVQKDEDEMGMTYEELSVFGKLRKVLQLGPVGMYRKLVHDWDHLTPDEVAEKVKRFFKYYSMNRHKMTTVTPSIHGEKYGCDDNRYDLRPFLYNTAWNYQFNRITQLVKHLKK